MMLWLSWISKVDEESWYIKRGEGRFSCATARLQDGPRVSSAKRHGLDDRFSENANQEKHCKGRASWKREVYCGHRGSPEIKGFSVKRLALQMRAGSRKLKRDNGSVGMLVTLGVPLPHTEEGTA